MDEKHLDSIVSVAFAFIAAVLGTVIITDLVDEIDRQRVSDAVRKVLPSVGIGASGKKDKLKALFLDEKAGDTVSVRVGRVIHPDLVLELKWAQVSGMDGRPCWRANMVSAGVVEADGTITIVTDPANKSGYRSTLTFCR